MTGIVSTVSIGLSSLSLLSYSPLMRNRKYSLSWASGNHWPSFGPCILDTLYHCFCGTTAEPGWEQRIFQVLGFTLSIKHKSSLLSDPWIYLQFLSSLQHPRDTTWRKKFSESVLIGTNQGFIVLFLLLIFFIFFQFREPFISFGVGEFVCMLLCILPNKYLMTLASDSQCLGFWMPKIVSFLTSFSATSFKINFTLIFFSFSFLP